MQPSSTTTDDNFLAQFQKKVEHQGTCPNCGYCPHCGRGGYHAYPWRYNPWYNPWYSYQGTAQDNPTYQGEWTGFIQAPTSTAQQSDFSFTQDQ